MSFSLLAQQMEQELQYRPSLSSADDTSRIAVGGWGGTSQVEQASPELSFDSTLTSTEPPASVDDYVVCDARRMEARDAHCGSAARVSISPTSFALGASPLTASCLYVMQREYDRDTWRMYNRIQSARAVQEQGTVNLIRGGELEAQADSSDDAFRHTSAMEVVSDDASFRGECQRKPFFTWMTSTSSCTLRIRRSTAAN